MTADPPPTPRTTIFVRLAGNRDGRTLTLKIPDGVDPLDLFALGFAIDGNQAACSVCRPSDDADYAGPLGDGPTLAIALYANQRALVDWLRGQGVEVAFA